MITFYIILAIIILILTPLTGGVVLIPVAWIFFRIDRIQQKRKPQSERFKFKEEFEKGFDKDMKKLNDKDRK